jgi:hypothetical protein
MPVAFVAVAPAAKASVPKKLPIERLCLRSGCRRHGTARGSERSDFLKLEGEHQKLSQSLSDTPNTENADLRPKLDLINTGGCYMAN